MHTDRIGTELLKIYQLILIRQIVRFWKHRIQIKTTLVGRQMSR